MADTNHGPLLHHAASVHACTELAAFDVEDSDDYKLLYYTRGHPATDETERQAAINAFIDIIRPCVSARQDGAFQVSDEPPPVRPQYCVVTLARRAGRVVGAAAFVKRCADQNDATLLLRRIQNTTERFRHGPQPGR